MQGNEVWGALARPTHSGQHMGTGSDPAAANLVDELRREVLGQWRLVGALRDARRDAAVRELAALRSARALERRLGELERAVEARGLLAGGAS